MHEKYLHEGERLLCARRSSPAVLIVLIFRGLLEAAVITAIIAGLLFVIGVSLDAPEFSPGWLFWWIVPEALLVAIVTWRELVWAHATFRITTERILMEDPRSFFHSPMKTIKWPQYQESEVDHRQGLDLLFLARPLKIRYGTADARYEARFPSLRFAEDIKHYLDKVDAAVRKNDVASIKPFVAKRRGKRDIEISND